MPPSVLHFQKGVRSEDLSDLIRELRAHGIESSRFELRGGGYVLVAHFPTVGYVPRPTTEFSQDRQEAAVWVKSHLGANALTPELLEYVHVGDDEVGDHEANFGILGPG